MPVGDAGKRLLVISGGVEAVPIIEKARSMGLGVVVSDGSDSAPGFEIADETILASTYDAHETARLALASHGKNPIHGVLAAAADVPATVSAVAGALGLHGPSEETARLASDKLAMKEAFEAAGVPVPWFTLLEGPGHLKDLLREGGKRLVIKPVDSRGARGVIRMSAGIDPEWAYDEAIRYSPSRRVMAEEWVEGRQISTESLVTEDGIATPGLSDRNYRYLERFSPFVIEDGGDLPALLTEAEAASLDSVLSGVARAFGMKRGTLKGDIVMGDNGPVVIEAAVRLSGGYFATHTIPLSSGVEIVEAAILIALGERVELDDYRPRGFRAVCQRFLFPEPGMVTELRVDENVPDAEGLEMMRIYVKPGDVIPEMTSHPSRAGMVITTGPGRAEAALRAERLLDNIHVRTDSNMAMEV